MKKITLLLFLISYLINAQIQKQIKIEINISELPEIKYSMIPNGNSENNLLLINNSLSEDAISILIAPTSNSSSDFRFKFGKGGKIHLKSGHTELRFNSHGQMPAYNDNKQLLSFPSKVEILDIDGNLLKDTIITFTDSNQQADPRKIINRPGLTKIPFHDSFVLKNYQNSGRKEILEILNFYLFNDKQLQDINLLVKLYDKNPFLLEFLKAISKDSSFWDRKEAISGLDLSGISLPSIGGVDVTNLADGLAKFLVQRTKEELAISFFDKFKKIIEDNNFRDIRTLFPETYKTLNAIGEEIYRFNAYMQTLREGFEKDLRELTAHLPAITENHPEFFNEHKELKAFLKSGCYIAEAFRYSEHPGDILYNYPSEYLESLNLNWKGVIQTLQLISSSLRDSSQLTDSPSYWVSPAQIKKLVSDFTVFKIYLGLLYEQSIHFKDKNDTIKFADNLTLRSLLFNVGTHFSEYYSSYKSYFTQLGTKTNKITTVINDIKKISNDSLALEQYFNFINASVDFLESTVDVEKLIPWKDRTFGSSDSLFFRHVKDSLSNYFNVARSATHIVWDIKRRSYASALVNSVSIYNTIIVKPKAANNSHEVMESLIKYGTFMATIVQAKNSDQVEDAIEAFSLPAGSSRIKRVSSFNVALNAYIGFYGAWEKIIVDSLDAAPTAGISAPIGINFAWGSKSGGSFSFFVSIIDLGAVASFRFGSQTEKIPTIQLKHIISPGLFLSFGFPDSPISLNLGVQMGPNLYAVNSQAKDLRDELYVRIGGSVNVDIPLLNFYTKPKD